MNLKLIKGNCPAIMECSVWLSSDDNQAQFFDRKTKEICDVRRALPLRVSLQARNSQLLAIIKRRGENRKQQKNLDNQNEVKTNKSFYGSIMLLLFFAFWLWLAIKSMNFRLISAMEFAYEFQSILHSSRWRVLQRRAMIGTVSCYAMSRLVCALN